MEFEIESPREEEPTSPELKSNEAVPFEDGLTGEDWPSTQQSEKEPSDFGDGFD